MMDAAAWTALGTWLLVIGTLIAVFWQTRQQRDIHSANMVMVLHDRFDSSLMKAHRKRLADTLRKRVTLKQRDDHVLVFMETLGLLTRRKVIDDFMVWNEFCWEITRYYKALSEPDNHIERLREDAKDKTLYCEFSWLNERMLEIDRSKREVGMEIAEPSNKEIQEFLADENSLAV